MFFILGLIDDKKDLNANTVLDNPTQRGMTDSMIPQGGGMQENMQVDMMNNVEPMASNAFGSPF